MDEMTFTLEVEHTDRTRDNDGLFTTYWTTVEVMAHSDTDAIITAAHMVQAIRPSTMVTGARIEEVSI